MIQKFHPISVGIAWCLAWGEDQEPKHDLNILQQMRQALIDGTAVPQEVSHLIDAVRELDSLKFPETLDELKKVAADNPILWNSKIGLVYGGATKIKQYVFEETKLPDIRGASAVLDRINLVDLPAFFGKKPQSSSFNYTIQCQDVKKWLQKSFPKQLNISVALIPELIIYSTGGNILAFCPTAFANDIASAIEKRYTEETITANSCAVADKFRLLETRFGMLRDNLDDTFWLEEYRQKYTDLLVEANFGRYDNEQEAIEAFSKRKTFNELTTKLAILFNQRRSGNETNNRPSRRYPPMCETHPYLRRDEGEKRSAITKVTQPPREVSHFSESAVRKRRVGDRAKTGISESPGWYQDTGLVWEAGIIEGWADRFVEFIRDSKQKDEYYGSGKLDKEVKIPQSLTHLSKVSNGYIAYIYADGNNMGGYIQNITTAKAYQEFSEDIANATEYSVYQALAQHLQPFEIKGIEDTSKVQNGDLIHPFEIITIGGDDIILIVPAEKAVEIAKTIGEQFEKILLKQVEIKDVEIKGDYDFIANPEKPVDLSKCHRYNWQNLKLEPKQCKLSISSGVLITAYNTPIYYATDLTQQLMKSAKEYAKILKEKGYRGGTVDFLTMKSVTMISSNIKEFRELALTKQQGAKLKLYAAPYTLYELDGLLKVITALKKAEFPKSQLYQVRSFLEQGKRTAIINYCYFRSRLKQGQAELKADFETAWCQAKTNEGNLAPWMFDPKEKVYETIWREIVDLYDFISIPDKAHKKTLTKTMP